MNVEETRLINNYEKYLKQHFLCQLEIIEKYTLSEEICFFLNIHEKTLSLKNMRNFSFIDKFKKLYLITVSIKYNNNPKVFLESFEKCIKRYLLCFCTNVLSLKYYQEKLKEEDERKIFNNYFNNLYINFEEKVNSKTIYQNILLIEPYKLLYKVLDNSFININENFPDKKFFYFFFKNQLKFDESNIVIKKVETDDKQYIDKKYNFVFHAKNEEKSLMELEEKALEKAYTLGIINKLKNREIFLDTSKKFLIENIKNWDIINLFDKRFMIYDNNFNLFLIENKQEDRLYYILVYIFFICIYKNGCEKKFCEIIN